MKTIRRADVHYNGAIWHIHMTVQEGVRPRWTDVEIQYARLDKGQPSVVLPIQLSEDMIRKAQKRCYKELLK